VLTGRREALQGVVLRVQPTNRALSMQARHGVALAVGVGLVGHLHTNINIKSNAITPCKAVNACHTPPCLPLLLQARPHHGCYCWRPRGFTNTKHKGHPCSSWPLHLLLLLLLLLQPNQPSCTRPCPCPCPWSPAAAAPGPLPPEDVLRQACVVVGAVVAAALHTGDGPRGDPL